MLDQLLVCLGCHWVLQLRLRAKFRFRTDRQRQLRPTPRWLIPVTAEGRFEFRALDWLSMAGLARSTATQRKACRTCEGMLRQRRRENECRLCPLLGGRTRLQRKDGLNIRPQTGFQWPVWRHWPQRSDERAAPANECCASEARKVNDRKVPHSRPLCLPQRMSGFRPSCRLSLPALRE